MTLTGKGNVGLRPKTGAAEPCPPECSPLQGVLLHRLWTGFPVPSPSRPSGRKCSLRFHFRAGPQGFACGESGWSLSRLPALMGFGTFPNARASLGSPPPGLWLRLGPEGPLRRSGYPTGVRHAVASVQWDLIPTPDSDLFSMSIAACLCPLAQAARGINASVGPTRGPTSSLTGYPHLFTNPRRAFSPAGADAQKLSTFLFFRPPWKTRRAVPASLCYIRADSLAHSGRHKNGIGCDGINAVPR